MPVRRNLFDESSSTYRPEVCLVVVVPVAVWIVFIFVHKSPHVYAAECIVSCNKVSHPQFFVLGEKNISLVERIFKPPSFHNHLKSDIQILSKVHDSVHGSEILKIEPVKSRLLR